MFDGSTRSRARSATQRSFAEAELFSRNWAFLSPEAQRKLHETVIFAAGVGLTSNIVTLACRTGFRRFILADGDRVELSNLNRQEFTLKQIGENKAQATAQRLRGIRPDVEVRVLPHRLDESNYQEPLSQADIVVNSIDFDQATVFLLNGAAQAANKPVLLPINLGWGGALLTFTAASPSLESFLGLSEDSEKSSAVARLLVTRIFERSALGLPRYLASAFEQFSAPDNTWAHDPQLGVAAYLTAALAVRCAAALANGEPVRSVPEVAHVDAFACLDPEPQALPRTP